MKTIIRHINISGLAFLAALAVLWQIAAQALASPNVPTFTATMEALFGDLSYLLLQALITLKRAGVGFAISVVVFVPLGIFLGRIRPVGALAEPVIEFLRPLPPIAVVPLAMMFLGTGDEAKLAIVVFGAAFPILLNTLDAVKEQDPVMARVARSLRLTPWERMALIDLPAALPRIAAGIRLSALVSILLTVVAELLLSTDGLGSHLLNTQYSYNVAATMATLIVVALLGAGVNALTNLVLHRLLRWHFARSGLARA